MTDCLARFLSKNLGDATPRLLIAPDRLTTRDRLFSMQIKQTLIMLAIPDLALCRVVSWSRDSGCSRRTRLVVVPRKICMVTQLSAQTLAPFISQVLLP